MRERLQRLVPILGEEGMGNIEDTELVVVGCGGNGATFCNLAGLCGFRRFALIDDDAVEEVNRNRLWVAPSDVGLPKIEIVKACLERFDPQIRVHTLQKRIQDPEAIGYLEAHPDAFLICCVDNNEARRFIMECFADHPILDLGAGVLIEKGNVEFLGAQASLYLPGQPCLFCRGLSREGTDAGFFHASIALNNHILAGLAMNMLLHVLTGRFGSENTVIYDGMANTVEWMIPVGDHAITRKPGCPICHPKGV